MFLLVPTLIGIVLALLLGGSLGYLATLPVRGVWAIVLSFVAQAALYATALNDTALVHQAGPALYIGALALVSFGVLSNWQLGLAARIVLLGFALNATVIVANGGRMPVDATALRATQGSAQVQAMAAHDPRDYNRALATDSSRLVILSDAIRVPFPVSHGYVCSIGDIFIALGAGMLAFKGTRRPWRRLPLAGGHASTMPGAAPAWEMLH